MRRRFFVYILASRTRRLYVGVTNDVRRRVAEHRRATRSFTARYRITRPVHVETFDRPMDAIRREKQLKAWGRPERLALVNAANPHWLDLLTEEAGRASRCARAEIPRCARDDTRFWCAGLSPASALRTAPSALPDPYTRRR